MQSESLSNDFQSDEMYGPEKESVTITKVVRRVIKYPSQYLCRWSSSSSTLRSQATDKFIIQNYDEFKGLGNEFTKADGWRSAG